MKIIQHARRIETRGIYSGHFLNSYRKRKSVYSPPNRSKNRFDRQKRNDRIFVPAIINDRVTGGDLLNRSIRRESKANNKVNETSAGYV